jgi:hypothetical protein
MKRTKKAKPFVFKAKPLTRAQKAKRTRDRNELTKRMRAMDPFYVHPDTVPAGKAYQWFSLEILGASNEDAIDRAKDDGWKDVPFSRHDFGRRCNAKGRIVVDNSVLMENSAEIVAGALKKDQAAARQMIADNPIGASKQEGHPFPIVSESFVISSFYETVPRDAAPVVVPVTISVRMDAGWQDAAVGLGLSNEEYARRRLLMTMPILAGEPAGDNDAVYEPVTLRVELERKK